MKEQNMAAPSHHRVSRPVVVLIGVVCVASAALVAGQGIYAKSRRVEQFCTALHLDDKSCAAKMEANRKSWD